MKKYIFYLFLLSLPILSLGQVNVTNGRTGSTYSVATYLQYSTLSGMNVGANTNLDVFLGYQSGYSNTTGTWNTYIGVRSGYSVTTGYGNTFSGYYSGYGNTGNYNTFTGYQSGYSSSFTSANTFTGYNSGYSNTNGYNNTFNGSTSGSSNTTGYNNTFSGSSSGSSNTTGIQNTSSGYNSGRATTTGSNNTYFGNASGQTNVTGSNNTAIGSFAGPNVGGLTNTTCIGYNAAAGVGNTVILGGTGTNAVNVGIGTSTPANTLDVVGGINVSATLSVMSDINGFGNIFATNASFSKVCAGGSSYTSTFQVAGSISLPLNVQSGSYTATISDFTIYVTNAASVVTITLPTATGITGRMYIVGAGTNSTGAITVSSASNIEGLGGAMGSSTILAAIGTYGSKVAFQSDGTNWRRIQN